MISETRFARSHHGFWHDLLPMAESYTRGCNRELARFAKPLVGGVSSQSRGLVNELGYRIFALCSRMNCEPGTVPSEMLRREAARAREFILSFRQHGRAPVAHLGDDGIQEAVALAERTQAFFSAAAVAQDAILVEPPFHGCGWLSACNGDALWKTTLFEMKAGDRTFRSTDVRQVLVYCALAFVSKAYDVDRVCLVNPRHGVYFSESLSDLCSAIAGRASSEVLADIVEYVSTADPEDDSG